MTGDLPEAAYYHALNLGSQADYGRLSILRSEDPNWHSAWKRSGAKVPADKEWRKLSETGVRLVLREDPEFPVLLREIPSPPWGLYVRGTLPKDTETCVAIVGTRKATEEGKEAARGFARGLARAGISVVSGLALGIDAAAEEGALAAGGRTYAVLANGLSGWYPRTNGRLGDRLLQAGGGALSEYPPGGPALPYRFLARNRIISGLCRGTLILEAPLRSGSLNTARFALEQNREVWAVPGPYRHPNYAGSHELIRQGASLATDPAQILADLGFAPPAAELSPGEELVLEILARAGSPLEVDKIIELTNLRIQTVSQALGLLAIKNMVREVGSGYVIQKNAQ